MLNGKTHQQPGESEPADASQMDTIGDPTCPLCGGLGYLRRNLPINHPDFGKVEVCTCRNQQISQQVRQRLFSLSHLDELSRLTFDNFEPRGHVGLWPQHANSLEMAYNQSRIYAQSLPGWLLLQGGYGCGKTHLAAAIANFVIAMGVPTLFITVPDLLDMLRFTFQSTGETFEERFEEIRQAPFLILDDFGTQNTTAWAQEKLFQIINYRYINRLPLVVTTNLDLRDIEERIRSRLEDPDLVTSVRILAPDHRRPATDIGSHVLSSLDLHNHCTFASFDLRKNERLPAVDQESLQKAFETAQEFASNPTGWMIFTGPYGCGKTHLAAAIAHYRRDHGHPQLFVVAPELFDHLRATFSPSSTVSLDRRFEEVKSAQLLVLDDITTQSISAWVREKLHQLINFRYYAELPTVFTTSEYLEHMDERIVSRMMDKRLCAIHSITAPAYSGSSRQRSKSRSKPRKT